MRLAHEGKETQKPPLDMRLAPVHHTAPGEWQLRSLPHLHPDSAAALYRGISPLCIHFSLPSALELVNTFCRSGPIPFLGAALLV